MKNKSQVISMDFVMTFAVYIFALSVFFFALRSSVSGSPELDIQGELLLAKLDQIYDDNDFLDHTKVDSAKLDLYIQENNYLKAYDLFRDFENPTLFRRIDYCVYFEDVENGNTRVVRNFAAGLQEGYPITVNPGTDVLCGEFYDTVYANMVPQCPGNREAIVLTKSVLYDDELMNMKVFVCAEKR